MSAAETAAPSHRRILRIALPIVLSNATVPILGAIDTAMVGQLGEAAPIGAVGIGAMVLSALTWVFGFLRMGTTGLVGQALGAGNGDEVSALLSRALLIGAVAGLGLIAAQGPLIAASLALLPASPEVETLARSYIAIRIWSAPAAIALYGATGWLIAQERTRAVLAVQLWMGGVNGVLDALFVLGLGWGVPGVAAATVLAEVTGLVLALWLCRDGFARPAWRAPARVFDPARLRRMAAVNADILIRTLLLQAMFVAFMWVGARAGDVQLAANQVLLQFLSVTAYALDGFAFAAEALVARAMGARAPAVLRLVALRSAAWGLGAALLLALGFALAGPAVIALMTTAPEVRSTALAHLPWMVAAPVVGVAAWILDGIFIGATRTADMRNMMLLSALIYGLALAVLVPLMGSHGIWAALLVSYVARAATLGARYRALERAAAPDARA